VDRHAGGLAEANAGPQDGEGADSLEARHMSIGWKSLLGCGVAAAGAITISTAQAAPEPFCRDYARAAVRQVELARSVPACDRGTGARWTTDYRIHFDWCMGAPVPAVEAERQARTNWIRSCRGR
jgi:hypothetical protein